MKTRAQSDMELAASLVQDITKQHPDKHDETRLIYGGLCHSFPVMVRTCGLCQALAFSASKAGDSKGREKAHKLILDHVGKLIGQADPLKAVREADTVQYMLYTRRVLSAWIYFKRFAESILEVKSAKEGQDAN
jgi:CRISPR-associated protein Cmr5